MSKKCCLLLRTVDNRHFLTESVHLPQLTEFSKIVKAELSVVRIDESVPVMSLQVLAKSFCTAEAGAVPEYEVVESRVQARPVGPVPHKSRQAMLERVREIRNYIRAKLEGGGFEVGEALDHFAPKYDGVTGANLKRHFYTVRRWFEDRQQQVMTVGKDSYRLSKPGGWKSSLESSDQIR